MCTYLLFEHNQCVPHVGSVCVCGGGTGMEFQEDPFHVSRDSDKKVNFS